MSESRYNYLKRITRRLQDEIVDIEETQEISNYFNLTGLDQVYGRGIHKLYVAGSLLLKRGTYIYVSIQDSAGRDLLINVPSSSEIYEQKFNPIARFTFTVDDGLPNLYGQTIQEVADGMATMIMVGTTTDNRKVRWTKKFAISKAIANQPLIDRGEWALGEVYNIADVVVYQGIFYKAILDHSAIPSILPTNLTYWRRLGSDSGASTALLVLSNDSHNVHFSYDLIGDYTGAYTDASVFRGDDDVSDSWVIEVESVDGPLTGSVTPTPSGVGTKRFTVTSIPAGSVGTINFKAYRGDWDTWEEGLVYQDTNLVQFVDTTITNITAPNGLFIPVGETEVILTSSFYEYGIASSSAPSIEWFLNGTNVGVYDEHATFTTAQIPTTASVMYSASIGGRQYTFTANVINLNASGDFTVIENPSGRSTFLNPDNGNIFLTASLFTDAVKQTTIDSYQWYKDGVAIDGQTGEHLVVSASMVNNSGSFHVVVTSNSVAYSSSAYRIFDIDQEFPVDIQNSIWECVTSHTSTQLNRPNTDAGFWIPRTNIGILRKSFSVNSTTDGIDNPVLIISSPDGDTFKNDTGQILHLTASIFAGGTQQDVSLNTFVWRNAGTEVVSETTPFLDVEFADLEGDDIRVFSATTDYNGQNFTGYFTVKTVSDGVAFYIDSADGYVIRNDLGSVELQIKFNVGGKDKTADLTGIDWYKNGASLGSSSVSLVVTADDVDEKVIYMASASYGGVNYEASRDVIDITDFVYVDILSDTEGFIFKDAYSPSKTLTAILEKDGTQADPSAVSYYWKIDGNPTASISDQSIVITTDQVIGSAVVSVTQSFESKDYYREVLILDNTIAGTNLYVESANGFSIKNKDTELTLTASLRMYGQSVLETDITDYEWYKNGVFTSSGKYLYLDANGVDNVDTFQARCDFRGYTYSSQETNVNDVLDGVILYIASDNGFTIKNSNGQLNLTARLYWGNKEYDADSYDWEIKNGDSPTFAPFGSTKTVLVEDDDVDEKATFKVTAQYLGEEFEATINIVDVTDGITLSLTNEQTVINFDTAGVADFSDAFTTASVLRGSTDVSSDWVFSTGSHVFTIGSASATFNPATGVLKVDSVPYPSLGFIPIIATKGSASLVRNYHIVTTTDGFTSYAVDLVSDIYTIKYDPFQNLLEPTASFDLTATPTNVPTPFYKFYRRYDSGTFTEVYAGSSNTYAVDPAIFPAFTASVTFRVDVHNVDGSSPVYAQKGLTIFKAFDGVDGEIGYAINLSNENHTVYCDSSGNPYGGELGETGFAITEVTAFRGGDELDIIFGGTPTLGQARVTATPTGCTIASASANGGLTGRYWVTSISSNSARVDFSILAENISTFSKRWTLTKQLDPQPPVNGEDGDDGTNGGGIVYRGIWNAGVNYIFVEGVRVDAVFHNSAYWFAKQNSTNQIPSTSSSFWAGAGGAFEMTATKFLLAEDATITKTLVMGSSDGVNTGAGIIRSAGATSIEVGNGYFLSASGDVRIGTATSGNNYIRWNSGASQIQIRSTNFALTGSNLAIGTGKVAVGTNAVTDTVASTDAGVVMDSSGYFKAYYDSNNYMRLNNTGMEFKASKLDIRAGTNGNYVAISSTDATYAMWIGSSSVANAPFWVKRTGEVWVNNLSASGNISARRVSLNNIQGDFWDGDGFQLGGFNGISYSGGTVNIGTNVSIAGSLTASAFRVDDDNEWNSSGFILGGTDGITYDGSGSVTIGSSVNILGALTASTVSIDAYNKWENNIFTVGSATNQLTWYNDETNGLTFTIGGVGGFFVSSTQQGFGLLGGDSYLVRNTSTNTIDVYAQTVNLSASGTMYLGGGTTNWIGASEAAGTIKILGSIDSTNNLSLHDPSDMKVIIAPDGEMNTSSRTVTVTRGAYSITDQDVLWRIDLSGNLFGGNDITATGEMNATDFNMSSDLRLKENIEPIQYGLREVMKLKPVQYNFKHQTKEDRRIGFIAQDMETVIPEVVRINELGVKEIENSLTISYPVLVSLLTKAIQEQQEQIEELKRKIN